MLSTERLAAVLSCVLLAAGGPPPPLFELPSASRRNGPVLLVAVPLDAAAAPAATAGAGAAAKADGSEARPFATIAAALRAAPDGAVIQLAAGDYFEAVVLDRPLVLQGRGPFRTRLIAPPASRWPSDPEVPVISLRGPGLTEVRALAIEGGAVGVDASGAALPKAGEPWSEPGPGPAHRLVEVALRGQYLAGLRVRGARVAFTGGELLDTGLARVGLGVEAWGSRLELRDLLLRRAGHRGIELRATVAQLEGLDSEDSGTTAVQVFDGCHVLVRGGRFHGQRGAAFFAGNAFLRLERVLLEGNEYGVLGARGARIELEGGEVLDQRVAGVALVNATASLHGTHIARGGTEAAPASGSPTARRCAPPATASRRTAPGSRSASSPRPRSGATASPATASSPSTGCAARARCSSSCKATPMPKAWPGAPAPDLPSVTRPSRARASVAVR